jgi:hypothetical protein
LEEERRREFDALLPWYVAGGLEDAERARLASLIAASPERREDMELEARLAAEVAALPPACALDVESGWTALQHRLKADDPLETTRGADQRWLRWAVVAQFCLLLLLGASLWQATRPGAYRTLSVEGAPTASGAGDIVVMFAPDTQEAVLRRILEEAGARIVDGPTAAGAYVVRPRLEGRLDAVAVLRGHDEVSMAAPLDPIGGR